MRRALVVVLIGAACSSKSDDCVVMIEKSRGALEDMARSAGRTFTADDRDQFIAKCRDALARGRRDGAMDCVLAAKGDAAARACYAQNLDRFDRYTHRAKATEAKLQLNRLGKAAKIHFLEHGAFPKGSAPLAPATPCCDQPGQQCTPAASDWDHPVWRALDFAIEEPFRFRYSYEGDGATFVAKATGDLACAGRPVTYVARGTAAGGEPAIAFEEP